MISAQRGSGNQRVVILAPTGKDAALTAAILQQAGLEPLICPHAACVEAAIDEGVGALLVAEEALSSGGLHEINGALSRQAPWSDLPVLLLTRYGADSLVVAQTMQALSNVTLLERPVRPATLLSSIRTALKARERQYQVGDYLAEQARTNAELAESIAERERVEEALRDADRRKDEFLATLAHELRNPLAPIRNSLHILRLSADSNPSAAETCEMIERQVGHLVRLVDDLMEVSRITRGKVELRREPVELAEVLRAAVEASRPLIESSQHQLAISIPRDPLILNADPIRLTQVFANLLNNAAKYMDGGGHIWLTAQAQDDEVIVSVRDSGVGIDAEMLPHIFKMFTQVDRSKRQSQGGLGIGLTLVRTLVEMHGGEVEARSPGLNEGSEFVVRLPLVRTILKADIPARESQVPILPHRRVLVVDDNQDAAMSLGKLLQLLGADVAVVHDGYAALEILSSFKPNVVLLDIGMPGMDGYEVARRIREQAEWQSVMLIALTGWGQEEDRQRADLAGFDHHLLKPADLTALRTLITSLDSNEPGN
jgi:two-component system, sensor histidine kinase